MAILRNKEIRDMSVEEAQARTDEIYNNYSKMKSQIRSGGAPENSGKMKEMRRAMARLKTFMGAQGVKGTKVKEVMKPKAKSGNPLLKTTKKADKKPLKKAKKA
jgi:large subunit ribosomal protein L29